MAIHVTVGLLFLWEGRWNMVRVTTQQVEEARQIDLLSYFEKYRPDDLVRITAREYCTVEHDSLKMSYVMCMWLSRKISGKSALDYLIKAARL